MKQGASQWLAAVFILLALATPGHAQEALSGKLTITGSSTVAPLVSEIAKRFEQLHEGVRIDVQTGGSSRGITDATRGTADIGMSSRALKDSEKTNITPHTIARDGVAILVHASNPISDLDEAQILAIYKGETKNWREVGGEDAAITVINRADGRSELELFTEHFKVAASDLKASLISGENQHGIKSVASDPNAIIYMSVGASERAVANGEAVKLLKWNGIEATSATVASGKLPMHRPLILVTRTDPSPVVSAFITYARSVEVHDLVKQLSYVPVE
jgi:phosphate transport system substrate-binding protein